MDLKNGMGWIYPAENRDRWEGLGEHRNELSCLKCGDCTAWSEWGNKLLGYLVS